MLSFYFFCLFFRRFNLVFLQQIVLKLVTRIIEYWYKEIVMRKIGKVITSVFMTLVVGITSLAGCASNSSTVKLPANTEGESVVTDSSNQSVGLTSGFPLSYDGGLNRDEEDFAVYDSSLYYINEDKVPVYDPTAMYISEADIIDTYNKLIAKEAQFGQSAVDEFIAERGTVEEWIERYAGNIYTTGSSRNATISSTTLQKYPQATWGGFMLCKSKDMSNWETCGPIDGYAFMGTADCWMGEAKDNWAPELKRDPITGMYILAFSNGSLNGNANTAYNPYKNEISKYALNPDTNHWYYDNMYLTFSIADNPEGPYTLLTAEKYYQYLAALNSDGTAKTKEINEVVNGVDIVKTVAVYRDDIFVGKDENKQLLGGEALTYLNNKGMFLNKNGDEVTAYTPQINFSVFHDEIIEAWPHDDIKNRANWPAMDINPFINDRGELFVYFTAHGSSLYQAQNVWVVKMKDWLSPEWDTLTHVLAPSYSIVYYDPDLSEDLDWADDSVEKWHSKGYYNYNFRGRSYAVNGIRGFFLQDIAKNEGGVNEGCHMIQYNGWYYLTYSPFGYGSPKYAVHMSVSDNPYGPFIKIKDLSPALGVDEYEGGDMLTGAGHHCFLEIEGEIWCYYHCFFNPENNYDANGNFLSRALAIDRIKFYEYDEVTFGSLIDKQIERDTDEKLRGEMTDMVGFDKKDQTVEEWITECFATGNHRYYDKDHKGTDGSNIARNDIVPIMYGNGPTYSLQPLPSLFTGYDNVAQADDVTITVMEGDVNSAKYANDGMVTYQQWSKDFEVVGNAKTGHLKIKISWDSPKIIRNIMLYNSRDYMYAFNNVKSIVFKLDQKPSYYPNDKYYNGYAYIKDLTPDSYGWDNTNMIMRKGGSAMATFSEITVSEIIITISGEDKVAVDYGVASGTNKNLVKLSEIYLMGKNA